MKKQEKEAEKLCRQQTRKEAQVVKAAEKQAQQELKAVEKALRKQQAERPRQSTRPQKAPKPPRKQIKNPTIVAVAQGAKVIKSITSKGRHIKKPQRFNL